MSSCFVCGNLIPQGRDIRKRVYVGSGVSGFNLTSNVVVNGLLNSALSRRRVGMRNYYSVRTVCMSCSSAIDQSERKRMFVLLAVVIAAILICAVSLIILRQSS